MGLDAWEVIESSLVYDGRPWLTLHREKVRLPEGREVDDYYQIHTPEYVAVVTVTAEGSYVMVRQYRHGIRKASLMIVGGLLERGEGVLETAKRELKEETGYVSDAWSFLGTFINHPSYGCGTGHFFLATSARKVSEPDSGDLEAMEILLMTREEVIRALREGEVIALGAAAPLALALNPVFAENRPSGYPG